MNRRHHVIWAIALWACNTTPTENARDTAPPCRPGSEGCECFANATCFDALECVQGVCTASIDEPVVCPETCDPNATCSDTLWGPRCFCNDGYEGSGLVCLNVDECQNLTHNCHANAACVDTQGSFTCECNDYYYGPGHECGPIDPATYVRDVSTAPIAWEVEGVGTFVVHGMSRLAWDIEVVETPATPPRVLKDAGAIRVPDITLVNLEPTGDTTLASLEAWAADTTPRSALVMLRGLRGEQLAALLLSTSPVDTDATAQEGRLARLTLSVGAMEADSYYPPQQSSPPAPATFLEVEGVTQEIAFLPPNIQELADGQHGSVLLRKVANHKGEEQSGDFIGWMEQIISTLGQSPPYIDRRALSLIHRDGPDNADEIDRVNCFEAWPHLLYLFNPAKSYPNNYLVDVSITTEWCEDG